jgi:3-oxoadipate enol-lactonase
MPHVPGAARDDRHRSGKFAQLAKPRVVHDPSERHTGEQLTALPSGGVLHVDGPARGPALLFLHGVGGAAWSWEPQRDAFGQQYRTFVWEARGHGTARPVADAGLSDYYTDASEALASVSAQTGAPVVLVAHSMGGLLAFALAKAFPERVRGMFLVDPVYATGEEYGHFSPRVGAIARFLCGPLLRSFARGGRLSRIIGRAVFARSFEDRARMEAAWVHQQRQIPFEYRRMLDESFGKPAGFELCDFAASVVAPVEVIEGTPVAGRMRFPALIARLEERLGPDFHHAVIAGGHYLQLDRPADVNAHLAGFIERLPAARLTAPEPG